MGSGNFIRRAKPAFKWGCLALALAIGVASTPDSRVSWAQAGFSYHRVYFVHDTATAAYLVPTDVYSISQADGDGGVAEAMNLLIEGPPEGSGMSSLLPKGTRLLSWRLDKGVAYVDFSRELLEANVGSTGEALLLGQIVGTLGEFPDVWKVRILVEGKPLESLAGHIDISGPLDAKGVSEGLRFQGFSDVLGHWAEGYVKALVLVRVISGLPDGTFRPDEPVSRAQFVKMLVESVEASKGGSEAGIVTSETWDSPFSDVTQGHWALPYLKKAIDERIVVPSDYGTRFSPDRPMTRREVAVMLARAMGLEREASMMREAVLPFVDVGKEPAWSTGYIAVTYSRGLMKGYPDGTFKPSGAVTRAEASALLSRFLKMGEGDILVAFPREGAEVGGRAGLMGVARVFEGVLGVRMRGGDQALPGGERTFCVHASEGAPAFGVFAVVFPVTPELRLAAPQGEALLESLWHSPKDGSEIGLVRRSVVLR